MLPPMKGVMPLEEQHWQARLPFFYGWVVVAATFSGTFIFLGVQFFGLSVLAVPMESDLGWSRSSIFLPLAIRGIIAALLAPFVGRLFDTLNGGRLLMLAGGLMSAVSLALVSLVEEQWQFLVLFGLLGGIAGLGNPLTVAAAIVPKWFVRYRGRAMAYATAGPGVAALTLPWALALIEDAIGWRGTWVVLGCASFVFTVLPALLIRRQPEDLGLTLDGTGVEPGRASAPGGHPELSLTPGEAFRSRTAWLLLAAHGLAFLSIAVLPTTFVPLFVGRGLTIAEAGAALIAYGVTSTVARFGWGFLLERSGVRVAAMILAAYGATAIALLIPDVHGVLVAFVLAGVAGYAIGGILVVNPLLWPTYFGRRYLGAINGLVTPVVSMAASFGPLILAFVYDSTGSYTWGLLLLVAAWALAIVPLYFVPTRPGQLP